MVAHVEHYARRAQHHQRAANRAAESGNQLLELRALRARFRNLKRAGLLIDAVRAYEQMRDLQTLLLEEWAEHLKAEGYGAYSYRESDGIYRDCPDIVTDEDIRWYHEIRNELDGPEPWTPGGLTWEDVSAGDDAELWEALGGAK